MERNWDLIREILRILAEKSPDDYGKSLGDRYFIEKLPSYHKNIVKYHLKMMVDARLIEGENASTLASENYEIKEMTVQGLNLWEEIKEKSVWDKIKKYAKDKQVELSFEAIKTITPVLLKTMCL